MPISRRIFLESGVLSAAGLVFGNLLTPDDAAGEQAIQDAEERRSAWPRKPESRVVLNFDGDWRFFRPDSHTPNMLSALRGGADIAAWNDARWEQIR